MERRGGKRAGAGRKKSTSKRDRALFIRCTAEERQEIKNKKGRSIRIRIETIVLDCLFYNKL